MELFFAVRITINGGISTSNSQEKWDAHQTTAKGLEGVGEYLDDGNSRAFKDNSADEVTTHHNNDTKDGA